MSDFNSNPLIKSINLIQLVDLHQPAFEGDKLVYITDFVRSQLYRDEVILTLEDVLKKQEKYFTSPEDVRAAKEAVLKIKMAGQCP